MKRPHNNNNNNNNNALSIMERQEEECTVGGAIRLMQARIVEKLEIDLPSDETERMDTISRCPYIIGLAYFHAICKGEADKENLGTRGSIDDIVVGNVIALKSYYGFMNIADDGSLKLGCSANSTTNTSSLPPRFSECFLIVAAGNERVALYNPWYQKFVHVTADGIMETTNSYKVHHLDDRPRMDESFLLKRSNNNNNASNSPQKNKSNSPQHTTPTKQQQRQQQQQQNDTTTEKSLSSYVKLYAGETLKSVRIASSGQGRVSNPIFQVYNIHGFV